jgi:hypothetical protein
MIGVDTTSHRITDISNATGLKKHSSLLFCCLVDYVSMRFIFIPVDDIVVTAPAFWLDSQGLNSVMDVIFAVRLSFFFYHVSKGNIIIHIWIDEDTRPWCNGYSLCLLIKITRFEGSIPGFLLKFLSKIFLQFPLRMTKFMFKKEIEDSKYSKHPDWCNG